MKKLIFSLSLMFSVSSQSFHAEEMISHSFKSIKVLSPESAQYVHPDSVRTSYLAVRGMSITGFSGESLEKLEAAFTVLETVMNSDEFKNRMINFENTQGKREFASNKGLTNEEVYAHLMEGREDLQQDTPGEMNFYLKLYNKWWSKVVGYTYPTTNLIHINWKFFKNFGPHQVAANLAHEWAHKMGFGHRSAAERDSVPYAVGGIVEELARKELESERSGTKVAPLH